MHPSGLQEIMPGISAISGQGSMLNNPSAIAVKGKGPIPGGKWYLGEQEPYYGGTGYRMYNSENPNSAHGSVTVANPDTGEIVGRGDFYLGENMCPSHGCVHVTDMDPNWSRASNAEAWDSVTNILEHTRPVRKKLGGRTVNSPGEVTVILHNDGELE
jgi:hypothetical protein